MLPIADQLFFQVILLCFLLPQLQFVLLIQIVYVPHANNFWVISGDIKHVCTNRRFTRSPGRVASMSGNQLDPILNAAEASITI